MLRAREEEARLAGEEKKITVTRNGRGMETDRRRATAGAMLLSETRGREGAAEKKPNGRGRRRVRRHNKKYTEGRGGGRVSTGSEGGRGGGGRLIGEGQGGIGLGGGGEMEERLEQAIGKKRGRTEGGQGEGDGLAGAERGLLIDGRVEHRKDGGGIEIYGSARTRAGQEKMKRASIGEGTAKKRKRPARRGAGDGNGKSRNGWGEGGRRQWMAGGGDGPRRRAREKGVRQTVCREE